MSRKTYNYYLNTLTDSMTSTAVTAVPEYPHRSRINRLYRTAFWFSLIFSSLATSPVNAQEGITNIFPVFIFDNKPLPGTADWTDPAFREYRLDQTEESGNKELSIEGDPVDFAETAHAREIETYLDLITRIEESEGPYSMELEEVFLELGKLYHKDNLTDSAIATYERSFHVNRINLGLYNPKQFEILENLSRAHLKNFNIQAALENQQYLLYLKSKLNNGSPEDMLSAAISYTNWLLNLVIYSYQYNISVDNKYLYYTYLLLETEEIYEEILDTIHSDLPELSSLEQDIYLKFALCHYYLALFTVKDRGRPMSFRNKEVTNPEAIGEKPRRQVYDSYVSGKQALIARLENLKENDQTDVRTIVEATIDLADWYEAFQNYFDATDTYTLAFNLLAESDLADREALIEQYFQPEIPIPAPAFVPKTRSLEGLKLEQQPPLASIGYMEVVFQLDSYGHPSRIALVETDIEHNQDYYYRSLRNNISSAKIYRPYMESPEDRLRREHNLRFYIYGVGDYRNSYISAVHDDQ